MRKISLVYGIKEYLQTNNDPQSGDSVYPRSGIIVDKQVVFCKDEKDRTRYDIGNVKDLRMSIKENFSNSILVLDDMNEKLNKAISLFYKMVDFKICK